MNKREQGQVLPLGLAMLVLAMLGAHLVLNTGQVATSKMRLANVADAAAYSGALWQARALNYQAYANRAMVANQVAVAQIVSMNSWAAHGAVTTELIATVLKGVPIVNALTTGAETAMAAYSHAVKGISTVYVPMLSAVNQILSASQDIMYTGTFMAVPDVVNAVVKQSDARFTAVSGYSAYGMTRNLAQWTNFTTRNNSFDTAAMDERQQMINDSRDDFSRKRNWRISSRWFPGGLFIKPKLVREGQTRLERYDTALGPHWEWKGKDTLSLHTEIDLLFYSRKFETPLGWAKAFANTRNLNRTLEGRGCGISTAACSRYTRYNKRSERLADLGVPSPVKRMATSIGTSGYRGIHPYRSLSETAAQSDDPRLRFKVEVSMPVNQAGTTQALAMKGNFNAPIEPAGDLLSSISMAEVYFQRPDYHHENGKKTESANGYNPYWQPKLGDVSFADRLLAFTLR